MNKKKYQKLLWGTGFVIIVLILTLFVMSQTYIQNLVYHERLSQMEEVTHQMFHSLEDVIDNHWDEVDVQCNYLYYTPLETDTDLYRYLKKLSELSNYHEKQIDLIAVDAAGRYYTEYGHTGLLREMNYLENAPQRVSYVSNSLTVDDSRMVFLKQLPTPITLQSGEKEITLRYFGIAQSMTQLNDNFRCDAYENNNSVYVLDNNGFKLFNANDTELLKGHNVYTVLSQMSYLHGSSFAAAKERLARTGSCYSNAVLDGTEYYYALKQMENAQWTLAFLVPAEYVAVNTQKLVNIVMAVIVGFAMVFSIMAVIAGWFLLREKQQRELRAGLIEEEAGGCAGVGRPQVELRLAAQAPAVVGLALNRNNCQAIAATMDLRTLARSQVDLCPEETTESLLGKMEALAREVSAVCGREVLGVGVASIGPLNAEQAGC